MVATGPSLNNADILKARAIFQHQIVVNDAWRLFPDADVLYANEAMWWNYHAADLNARGFAGERWSSHSIDSGVGDDKLLAQIDHHLSLVAGRQGDGFCFEPGVIHYGNNSGFQAINLALQFGATEIWLLGFDMQAKDKTHFFGDHPPEIAKASVYAHFIEAFNTAGRMLPPGIRIINATPDSALTCFERGTL